MILKFDHCCCCIDLRIGCLILGWLGVVVRILEFWVLLALMDGIENEETHEVVKLSPVIGIISLLIVSICFFFELLLLLGVYKKRVNFVKAAWAYLMVSAAVTSGLQLVDSTGMGKIFGVFLGFCLEMYFALCVRSYYLEMKGEEFQPTIQGGPA